MAAELVLCSASMAHLMTEELRVRRRERLREKEVAALHAALTAAAPGHPLWGPKAAVEVGEFLERRVIVVDNKVFGLYEGDSAFLALRALLGAKPTGKFVTVDMGAVKFVTNGADVMAPGIVEADPSIVEGDWVWVRDERNKQPLAVGKAIVAGASMVRGKGKAIKSVHHVGDKLWTAGAET